MANCIRLSEYDCPRMNSSSPPPLACNFPVGRVYCRRPIVCVTDRHISLCVLCIKTPYLHFGMITTMHDGHIHRIVFGSTTRVADVVQQLTRLPGRVCLMVVGHVGARFVCPVLGVDLELPSDTEQSESCGNKPPLMRLLS
jgi:hypothetical protein